MLTRKGIALWAAIQAGLLQKIDDTSNFDKFWELYDEEIKIRFEVKQYVSDVHLDKTRD